MTDDDVMILIEKIRQSILAEELPATYLSEKAEVSYNTAKGFLDGTKTPDFRTIIRMIDAAGLDIRKVFGGNTYMIEVNGAEQLYARRYKRLAEYDKAMVHHVIDAFTSLEKENRRKEAREKASEESGDSDRK